MPMLESAQSEIADHIRRLGLDYDLRSRSFSPAIGEQGFMAFVYASLACFLSSHPEAIIRRCPYSQKWFWTTDARKIYASPRYQRLHNLEKRRGSGNPA